MCAHKAWGIDTQTGKFATAQVRVYPWLLCERLGACAFAAVTARDGRDELQHEPEQETGVTHGTSG